jgi:hypothetical protein
MRSALVCGLLFFVVMAPACGGGGGGSSPTPSPTPEPTAFEKMQGEWTVRLNEPFTSCNTLDLGDYAGAGYNNQWRLSDVSEGTLMKLSVEDVVPTGESPSPYDVTSNTDPFTMERVWGKKSGQCNWTYTRSYEVTFVGNDHVVGTQRTDITSSTSVCEQCYYRLRVEIKRGLYESIDAAP